ncbi:MAG: LacI family DNA-binding transcriptional regulator [Planctomycetota bacterium]
MSTPIRKPISQQDLAKIAGVSRLTVQRALDGLSGVSEDTVTRIRQLAVEHGYRRNTAALATRSGRLGSIDLLVSNLRGGVSRIPEGLLDGVHEALTRHGLRLTLSQLSDERLSDPEYMPNVLKEFMADGVLINYTFDFPPRMLELLRRNQIPAIWLNTELDHDAIYPDDREAGRLATQHMIDQGHRKIGFIKLTKGGHYSEVRRIEGYRYAMQQAGLEPRPANLNARQIHLIEEAGYTDDERLPLMLDFLEDNRDLTAVVAYSALCARVLHCGTLKLGLKIPEDLSVITVDDRVVVEPGLVLDTVTLGWQAIGSLAIEMLLKKIDSPRRRIPSRAMPVHLRRGGTTRPLSS